MHILGRSLPQSRTTGCLNTSGGRLVLLLLLHDVAKQQWVADSSLGDEPAVWGLVADWQSASR